MSDPVYEAHKERVKNKPSYRRAYNYEPEKDASGEALEWVKAHAKEEITREDQASMNCGIFTDLQHVCNYIGDVEKINAERTYVALCVKGRNHCYHKMKANNDRDVFTDIAEQVSRGKRAIDSPSKRVVAASSMAIFFDVQSTKFHTDRQTLKIAVEESKKCGVKTAHLNLYWTLTGLKYIVDNDPMYYLYKDEPLFDDALRPLIKADRILNERMAQLQSWMDI